MFRFLLPAVAGLVTLALTGPVHAHGYGRAGGVSHSYGYRNFGSGHSYGSYYGTRMSHGYAFSARNFSWSSRRWSGRYGRYCYWSPYMNCWYYWNAAQSSYYPLSYLNAVPPTAVPPAPGMVGPVGPGDNLPPYGPDVP